ncbi:PKD domain-containing protein [Mucilaginibacter antarcticus]|uniref:PKD domain-containing protein n=1 Tax=Mucilaginibacter antarcticus TaxID=1855725 RepID=UPI00362E29C4
MPLTTGCSDKSYKLQSIIPFETPSITWKIDGEQKPVITNPTYTRTVLRDGKTLYVYEYPDQINFTAGTHVVIATVFNPNTNDDCGANVDIENVFSITDPPGKDIGAAVSNCLGDPTVFKDNTTTATSNVIKSWEWDFGDGNKSTDQNPSHTYAAAGDYDVRLTVVDYSGCLTVSDIKKVHIVAKPVANFTLPVVCIDKEATFTSTSLPVEPGAIITKWEWDFGDGTPVSTLQNPTHTYAAIQNYNVKLTVTTAAGCISIPKILTVPVNPQPLASFTLPDACVMDRNSQFTTTSTISDGTQSEFKYDWDFGDPGSGAANKSASANPQHSYSREGNYIITLTVTSKYGCVDIKQDTFTVNSADPHAKFAVDNKFICGTDGLTFVDGSKPDFGEVTRIRFYYDLANRPTEYQEFYKNTLRADKTYHIDYPINNTGLPISYNVKLVAFTGSGTGCTAETATQQIVINPSPWLAYL